MPRRINRALLSLSVLAISLGLSGCIGTGGIAPQGKALEANELATDEAIAHAARDANWPTAQWWQAYGDPQLNRWIDLAVQGSPTMAMAAARVRQARSMQLMSGEVLKGHVESISRGIYDRDNPESRELIADVNPTFNWVRLAQRVPVRIHIDEVPEGVLLAAGITCTVVVKQDAAE